MSFANFGVVGFVLYLVLLLGVAELARRARIDRSPADHFLAGRHLGTWVLLLTLYATAYSGNSLLGYPGEAYRRGYSWIMATGFMLSIVVVFHVLVPRLRPIAVREGFVTPGDWVHWRFGGQTGATGLRVAVAILMSIALANFLVAQLIAMGHVAREVTGGQLPFGVGVVGLAAMILFYETRGGMRAVAWTDAAQGVLMLVGLATLLAWLIGDAGGLGAISEAIARQRPGALAVPDARECANWVSSVVLMGLASVVYPQAIQRIYAARSGASLKRALALMSFMPLTTTLVVTVIGWAAIPRLAGLGHVEADTVMPRLLAEWAGSGPGAAALALLVLIGALAAIMSTADSVLLSLGSVVAGDLLRLPRDQARTTRIAKTIAAALMVVAVGIALSPRVSLWRLIEIKMELLIQCVPAFLVAIHWSRLTARACLVGLVAGVAVAGGAFLLGEKRIHGVHVGLIGLGVNLLLAVVVTALTPAARPGSGTAATRA